MKKSYKKSEKLWDKLSRRKSGGLKYNISKPPLDFSTQNRHRMAVSCVPFHLSLSRLFSFIARNRQSPIAKMGSSTRKPKKPCGSPK